MTHIKLEFGGKKYFQSDGKWYSHLGERKPTMDSVLNSVLSNLKNEKLWVGNIEKEIYVYDGEITSSENIVTFWSLLQNRFVDIDRIQARSTAKKIDGAERNTIIERYRKSVVVRHRLRIQRMDKKYTGIRESIRKMPRETYCWSCKQTLTSEGFPECIGCGWILCECGACGCERR